VDRVTFISDGAACPLEEAQVAVSQWGERGYDSDTWKRHKNPIGLLPAVVRLLAEMCDSRWNYFKGGVQ
jgi:hypothetical protein